MARPAKEINPIVPERIKFARKNTLINGQRLTQGKLADLLYVSVQAVKNWEQGITSTDDERLQEIARICNVDFLWLKGLDSETIIGNTKKMLDETSWQEVPSASLKSEIKSYALIYSLLMCGYKLESIFDKQKYSDFMESEIRKSIEFYMTNLNNQKE